MDPNECIKELRQLAQMALNETLRGAQADVILARMAELFEALDGWMGKKGFMPKEWSNDG